MRVLGFLALLLGLLGLGLGTGCQTGDVLAVVPVSGGGKITVPLTRQGPLPGHGGGYQVGMATLYPGEEKRQGYYAFALLAEQEPALQRVVVEDISDDKAALLIDEAQPVFKDRRWEAKSAVMPAEDPRLAWVFQITASMRVYRFTLTTREGKVITFNHVTAFPPFMKAAMRNRWGETY